MPFKERKKKDRKRTDSGSFWWGAGVESISRPKSKKTSKKESLTFPALTRQSAATRKEKKKAPPKKAPPTKQKQRPKSTQRKRHEKSVMDYMEELVCSMCEWIEKTSVYYYSAYIVRPLTR
mmetsp:Transcript_25267/g.54701  ORF Transcript_25267/g.54701 Transcript_25267/m.54701 type:complete len:121 (+) Transcript_25267:172-534(+)